MGGGGAWSWVDGVVVYAHFLVGVKNINRCPCTYHARAARSKGGERNGAKNMMLCRRGANHPFCVLSLVVVVVVVVVVVFSRSFSSSFTTWNYKCFLFFSRQSERHYAP